MVDPFDLMMFNKQDTISVEKRVEYYKKWFEDCRAVKLLKGFEFPVDRIEALEAIRALNTELADLYMVSIPVITCWVRDDNYVSATGEMYLTEPELEPFLHQFRHHLQNVERKYDRRGLTAEGLNGLYYKVPYTKCVYKLYGEDDARAWARMVIELAS